MKIFLLGVGIYAALVGLMFFFQRRLMYFPEKHPATPESAGLSGIENLTLSSEDGTRLQAWYIASRNDMPVVVYFHGNAGTLLNRAATLRALADEGFGVLAVSYRGYGNSDGSPSQTGIYSDARTAIRHAQSLGYSINDLVLFGESLGTGVAVKMASEFPVRAVALQAPYTSVAERAAEIYRFIPVKFLIRDQFASQTHLRELETPLIIFHGETDITIPARHGRTMLETSPAKHKIGHFFPNVGHTEFDVVVQARLLREFIETLPDAKS